VLFGDLSERVTREMLACDCVATDTLVRYGDWREPNAVGAFFGSLIVAMMVSVEV
jgi:hypothetical protein